MASTVAFQVWCLVFVTILVVSIDIKWVVKSSTDHEEKVHQPDGNVHGYDGENCTIRQLDNKSWEECGNKGYTMDCGNVGLRKIPKSYPALNGSQPRLSPPLALLNLSHNNFGSIPNNSFVLAVNMNSSEVKWLYLYYCNISHINSDAFVNLTGLLYLNLTYNSLTWPDGFGKDVFKPLVNLRDINFYHNNITTFKGLGYEMQYMRQLKGLFINLCRGCKFGPGFSNLTNLRNLSLSGARDGSCNVSTIANDTFTYVTTIQNLFIGFCNVHVIELNAFAPFKHLVKLDMSYNPSLHFDGMNRALYGLQNSTTLQILNVNKIYPTFGLGVELKAEHLTNLKTLQSLNELHMDLNKIEVVEKRVLYPDVLFPTSLKSITLSGNRLTNAEYTHHIHALNSIVYLDISRQFLLRDPFYHEHFETKSRFSLMSGLKICDCKGLTEICLPENVEFITWRDSLIDIDLDPSNHALPFLYICGAHSLRKLDLAYNMISAWNSFVFGLDGLTFLDLSRNHCSKVSRSFFDSFPSLKYLNLSGNYLSNAFSRLNSSELPKLFQKLKNLEVIDLSFNTISHLPEDMFKNLENVTHVYLRVNFLNIWNTSLEKSRHLKLLDLAFNKLNVLGKPVIKYLDSIKTKNHNVTVNLTGNPLDCSCSHLYFLQWLKTTDVDVSLSASECSIEGKRYPLSSNQELNVLINLLENDVCKDRSWITWTSIGASIVGTGILSGFCCFIVYKHRWKLRYMYYTRHRRHTLEGYDRLFQFDAFISYAKTLGRFMKDSAVPALQDVHKLTTWVYDKDSVPGASMAENIMHAISNSKKVVLFVNGDFLSDTWCEYETNMALVESVATKRKIFIIVLLQKMAMKDLPIYIQKLLNSESSLDYPDNEADRTRFWMNLAEEIKS